MSLKSPLKYVKAQLKQFDLNCYQLLFFPIYLSFAKSAWKINNMLKSFLSDGREQFSAAIL